MDAKGYSADAGHFAKGWSRARMWEQCAELEDPGLGAPRDHRGRPCDWYRAGRDELAYGPAGADTAEVAIPLGTRASRGQFSKSSAGRAALRCLVNPEEPWPENLVPKLVPDSTELSRSPTARPWGSPSGTPARRQRRPDQPGGCVRPRATGPAMGCRSLESSRRWAMELRVCTNRAITCIMYPDGDLSEADQCDSRR